MIEDERSYALLGVFAGRPPGMGAVIAMVRSWGVKCHAAAKANGYVLFTFQSADDRDLVYNGEPNYVFGRRLFFHRLPEIFILESADYSPLPVWVKFPGLPKSFWHPAALSKITSCIGEPVCMDKMTVELKGGEYARALVQIEAADPPVHEIPIILPDGTEAYQKVVYEFLPKFCLYCGGNGHF